MPLTRSSTVKQLKKLRKESDRWGYDIGKKSDGDLKGANVLYVHEVPSAMKVDTYEDFVKKNGEGRKTQKHMNNLKTYKSHPVKEELSEEKLLEMLNEMSDEELNEEVQISKDIINLLYNKMDSVGKNLEMKIDSNSRDISILNDNVAKISKDLDRLAHITKDVKDRVDIIENRLDIVENKLGNVESTLIKNNIK